MNAPLSPPEQAALAAGSPPPATWLIVTQVKSERVLYFTDDAAYAPPAEADWCYVSSHAGVLPEGMTLRNCWGWRFNGGVFTDARAPARADAAEPLLQSNRRALLRLLHDKIEAVREPWAATLRGGHELRRLKRAEARRFLAAGAADAGEGGEGAPRVAGFPLLEAAAVARGISLREAASLIEARARQCEAVWLESERFREQLTQAIARAGNQAQLLELREWLLERVYPALSERFNFRVDQTTPPDPEAPLSDTHRVHEIARLKAQLREAVNRCRAPLHSDYVLNDDARRHKARLAQAVLARGEAAAQTGMDLEMLRAWADARALTLQEGARALVEAAAAAARLLADTEKLKDELLARIDAVRTLRDVHALDAALEALQCGQGVEQGERCGGAT